MCWCAPTAHRGSLIESTKKVCTHAPCIGWCARSLCWPKGDSAHWERYISLGFSIWEQTSCWDRGWGPGNGCFTQMWWSKSGECLARFRWTSSLLRRQQFSSSSSSTVSAYHTSLGGQSMGRNTLVTRFLRGALRPQSSPVCHLGTWWCCSRLSVGLPSSLSRRFLIAISL